MKNIKLFISILFLFISSFLSSRAEETIRWAADTESGAPYVFQNPRIPTQLIGYEADIIYAICKEMGKKPVFVQNQWDGLIPGLNRGDYDMAINGLEITDDRKAVVNFSVPYYITYEQLVVKKGNKRVKTLSDLVGKKVGTLKNALAERILRAKGGIDVRTYDSEVNSFTDVENGRLEAVLIDAPVALYYAGWNVNLELVGQPIGEITYGIAIRKGDKQLLAEVNQAIENLKKSGKLREILESWNLWNYMMAIYLNDHATSNVTPKHYNDFLQAQGRELSLSQYIERYLGFLPVLGEAAYMTVKISVLSMCLAIVLGLLIALTRVYAPKPLAGLAVIYIEVIRGTPLLLQLFFIFYALPEMGIKLPPFIAAVLGLGLNYAAYEAENYRAGLFSVPKGQMEAALSLGMTRNQALWHIILPQAVRLVIPPITNDFISLLKDSSLVSVITLVELTKVYNQLSATYFDYTGAGILVAVIYLLLGLPFVRLSRFAEKKFSLDKRLIKTQAPAKAPVI